MKAQVLKQDFVENTVRQWLAEGKYRPGERLPTGNELARIFGINQRTVAVGLSRLVDEKLLECAPRRGIMVSQKRPIPTSNAVGLISPSSGDMYADLARCLDELLHKKSLFPIVVDNDLVTSQVQVEQFLTRMLMKQQPTGFIMEGAFTLPYDYIAANPNSFSNTVFILYYHRRERIPFCRFVTIDFTRMGHLAVDYLVGKGAKRILFPAICERFYTRNEWNSMQVRIMKGMQERAYECGVIFDEELFQLFLTESDKVKRSTALSAALKTDTALPGVFCWSDGHLVFNILPILEQAGKNQHSLPLLATHNTHLSKEYGFASFDFRIREILERAVSMLTGESNETEVLMSPQLIEHPSKID